MILPINAVIPTWLTQTIAGPSMVNSDLFMGGRLKLLKSMLCRFAWKVDRNANQGPVGASATVSDESIPEISLNTLDPIIIRVELRYMICCPVGTSRHWSSATGFTINSGSPSKDNSKANPLLVTSTWSSRGSDLRLKLVDIVCRLPMFSMRLWSNDPVLLSAERTSIVYIWFSIFVSKIFTTALLLVVSIPAVYVTVSSLGIPLLIIPTARELPMKLILSIFINNLYKSCSEKMLHMIRKAKIHRIINQKKRTTKLLTMFQLDALALFRVIMTNNTQ